MGRRGNGGKVPLGQLFLIMSVGCMQREVQNGRRPSEKFAQNSKIKPARAPPSQKKRARAPSALGSGRTLAPPARKVKFVPLARSMPILGAARGAHGEQHDLEIALVKHVLLPLKVCAAAHATRAAHLTASSRRVAVRRLHACPAQYHAGRVV